MVSVGGWTKGAQGRALGVDGEGRVGCATRLGSVAYVASYRVLRGAVHRRSELAGEREGGALQLRPTDPPTPTPPEGRLVHGALPNVGSYRNAHLLAVPARREAVSTRPEAVSTCGRMTLPRWPTPKHLAALAALATLPLTPLQAAGASASRLASGLQPPVRVG